VRVAIVYNEPDLDADAAEADVLDQVRVVSGAVERLGHETHALACGLNLESLGAALDRLKPDLVFNLVEALGGTDALAPLVPLLLDARRVPYTGAGSGALLSCADKVAAKRRMRAAGLPSPDFYTGYGAESAAAGRYIVKARSEHASLGMDDTSVFEASGPAMLDREIERRGCEFGTAFFAERFVPGREFNLALLSRGAGGAEVLPAAEIVFSGFPADKPNIVGYRAKWSPDSFEYGATERRLEFPPQDEPLLRCLERLALECWRLFGLRGYARVDFRVDDAGRPWILEVNPNPCLAPDAGFAAALEAAGIPFVTAMTRVLADAGTG
jgi:D-alanine-D-alanine ligase